MQINDIPSDSILRRWTSYLTSTEVPLSYQIVGGLSAIGAVLRRNRWIDQVEWRVYPNQSVMFIGPSGIGKDTIINRIQRSLTDVEYISKVPCIGGVTMEAIHAQLARLPAPAAAYIAAGEMTAFFGKADYQANMLTGMTNLLSNGDKIDITTKGALNADRNVNHVAQFIIQPTATMHAGSTVEWLHGAMPKGTLEGGFIGRFLIIVEEFSGRHIALVKSDKTKQELAILREHLDAWKEYLVEMVKACAKPREMIVFNEADYLYTNWYHNRFKQFSRAVMPYANRSRDMVLRLAMLMALSRGHFRHIEEEDVAFALKLISEVASKIDAVVLPPLPEAQLAQKIVELLPMSLGQIYNAFAERYGAKNVDVAVDLLRKTSKIFTSAGGIIRSSEDLAPVPEKEN